MRLALRGAIVAACLFGSVGPLRAQYDAPRYGEPPSPFAAAMWQEEAPQPQQEPAPSEAPTAAPGADAGGMDPGGAGAALAELAKNITVSTGDPDFKLLLGGAVVADVMYHSARPVAPGTPFFLTPDSPFGHDQGTFDAHARQTSLLAGFSAPEVCGFEAGGLILVNLYNDAVIVDRYGLLPIQAYGQLKNDWWRFAAGLQMDIFNPVLPTVLPFSYLASSGNAGLYRGQLRVERFFYPGPQSQITLTGGISEPIPTTIGDDFEISEDNGWPNLEGRAALGLGPIYGQGPEARRLCEVGVSGVVGEIRTTDGPDRVVADVWGLGADFRYEEYQRWGMAGEVFTGETLGTYGGGVLQTVHSATFEGIRSAGWWAEVYYYLCPPLHTHWGYGQDDCDEDDLAVLQIAGNETFFANLIWDINKAFRVAGEVTYRQTDYLFLPDNDGVGLHAQFRWKF